MESRFIWSAPDGGPRVLRIEDPTAVNRKVLARADPPPAVYRRLAAANKERGLATATWKLMLRHEVTLLNAAAEKGHVQYLPNGCVLLEALLQRSERACEQLPVTGFRVRCPDVYAVDRGAAWEYIAQFANRNYLWSQFGQDVVLRSDPGLGILPLLAQAVISHHTLPLGAYERQVCYRAEPEGFLRRLARVRSFNLVAMIVLSEPERTWEYFDQAVRACIATISWLAPADEVLVRLRVESAFLEHYRAELERRAVGWGSPVLVEASDEIRAHYRCSASIGPVLDDGEFSELGNVQIDEDNAARFGIAYTDSKGARRHPGLLQFTPLGAVERAIYTFYKLQLLRSRTGETPGYPNWLAPTQLRLIPTGGTAVPEAQRMMQRLSSMLHLRVDLDDRNETVGRKVRDAQQEWIPFHIVVGPREQATERFTLTRRVGDDVCTNATFSELADRLRSQFETSRPLPVIPLARPAELSRRLKW